MFEATKTRSLETVLRKKKYSEVLSIHVLLVHLIWKKKTVELRLGGNFIYMIFSR